MWLEGGIHRLVISMSAIVVLATGCAAEIYRVPVQFHPASSANESISSTIVMTREVSVTPSTGYTRVIPVGSRWQYVGRVQQGKVFAIRDDVFMLEGKDMHEAYCVVDGSMLVGFYLPVEEAFVPLMPAVVLSFK